jgi:hypothetical protein
MTYQKPAMLRNWKKVIAELEEESIFLKEDIETSAALFMHNLKPINILRVFCSPYPMA